WANAPETNRIATSQRLIVLCLCSGLLHLRLELCETSFHFAGKVRDDSDQPLSEHQLRAVVHLVLLNAKDHFETSFAGRLHAGRVVDVFGEKLVGLLFQPASELLSVST